MSSQKGLKEEIVKLLGNGSSYNEISNKLNCAKSTISYHASKNNLKRLESPVKHNWPEIKEYYYKGFSVRECQLKFNFSGGAWSNQVNKGNIIPRYPTPIEDYLIENINVNRSNIKNRLIKNELLENKCAKCGILPEWENQPLVLVIDHINGIYNDYRLKNLRLLCPNCNSQTDTFCGRNKAYKNKIK